MTQVRHFTDTNIFFVWVVDPEMGRAFWIEFQGPINVLRVFET